MSRFHHLEFGEPQKERKETTVRQPMRGEASWMSTAQEALESGRFEEALRCYAKALEFNPANAKAWGGQVRMLLELNEAQEAKLWVDKALETWPNEPELLAAKGVALGRSGDPAAALAFSDAAVAEGGEDAYVWLARADVLLARQEKTADYCVEKAIGIAPVQWLASWLASRIHSFHRQFARALQLAQNALETGADRAVVWCQIGECRLALGMAAGARTAFEQACQLDPASVSRERIQSTKEQGWGERLRGWYRQWRQS